MEIIGLAGYARSGKDEAAKLLTSEYGFKHIAFADKLRDMLLAIDPIVAPSKEKYFTRDKTVINLSEVIDVYGWDGYKNTEYGTEIRRLLQRLGTEGGRKTLWDSIWIDAAFAGLTEDAKVVVSDVRFPNEADAIKARGGHVWRVNRAGIGPANDHPSETSLDNYRFDRLLYNDGSLENYRDNVRRTYESGNRTDN
jgi:hypothetical protein